MTSNTAASIADSVEDPGSTRKGCFHCRDACESLKRTLAIWRQLPTPDVPASLAASVKAAIHAFLNQR